MDFSFLPFIPQKPPSLSFLPPIPAQNTYFKALAAHSMHLTDSD